MARITIEDCLDKVNNHFELVLVAAQRARQLLHGWGTSLERENDKPAVVALREIAEGEVGKEVLDEPAGEELHVGQVVAELIKNDPAGGPDPLPDFDVDNIGMDMPGKTIVPPSNEETIAENTVSESKMVAEENREEQDKNQDDEQTWPPSVQPYIQEEQDKNQNE